MIFAFDRDGTVETSNGPIPISTVRTLDAQGHDVWAIGNQLLREEAGIRGVIELLGKIGIHESNLRQDIFYSGAVEKRGRLYLLRRLYPHRIGIVVDDSDLSDMCVNGWIHFYPQDFLSKLELRCIHV